MCVNLKLVGKYFVSTLMCKCMSNNVQYIRESIKLIKNFTCCVCSFPFFASVYGVTLCIPIPREGFLCRKVNGDVRRKRVAFSRRIPKNGWGLDLKIPKNAPHFLLKNPQKMGHISKKIPQ